MFTSSRPIHHLTYKYTVPIFWHNDFFFLNFRTREPPVQGIWENIRIKEPSVLIISKKIQRTIRKNRQRTDHFPGDWLLGFINKKIWEPWLYVRIGYLIFLGLGIVNLKNRPDTRPVLGGLNIWKGQIQGGEAPIVLRQWNLSYSPTRETLLNTSYLNMVFFVQFHHIQKNY
jgi:hypothetical protein